MPIKPLSAHEVAERLEDETRLFEKVFPLEISERASSTLRDTKRYKDLVGGNASINDCQPKYVEEPQRSTSTRKTEEQKDNLFNEDREKETKKRETARRQFEELETLRDNLAGRNIKAGKLLGLGTMGVVFELVSTKDNKEQIVDSAVLRIDPVGINGIINNPAAATPIHQESNGHYEATIVAKAKEFDPGLDDVGKYELIRQSLAIFNSTNRGKREEHDLEGKLPHLTDLDYLQDLRLDQFMMMPGVSLPVLTDISSMSNIAITRDSGLHSMDTIDGFIKALVADGHTSAADIRLALAPEGAFDKMQGEVNILKAAVRDEIAKKGIDIPGPTAAEGVEIMEEIGAQPTRGHEAGAV